MNKNASFGVFVALFSLLSVAFPTVIASSQSSCSKCDIVKDGVIDFQDFAIFASCWMGTDTTPPTPDPSEWPEENAFSYIDNSWDSIAVSAVPATDEWMGDQIEYFFEWYAYTPEYQTNNSGWVSDPNYIATGLLDNTEYTFRVKTRDPFGNETNSSPPLAITTKLNNTAPFIIGPDNVHVSTADWEYNISGSNLVYTGQPYSSAAIGATYATITMSAEPGVDPDGDQIYYLFERVDLATGNVLAKNAEAGNISNTWTDGLDPDNIIYDGVTYHYRVTMIDEVGNFSGTSNLFSIVCEHTPDDGDTTPPPVPTWKGGIETIDCLSSDDPDCPGPGTWNLMEVDPVSDPEGFEVQYYFEEIHSSDNSGWISEPRWKQRIPGPGIYYYKVKCRDTSQRMNQSGWSSIINS